MKNLPEHFVIPFLGHAVEVTQVDRIDPHLMYTYAPDADGAEDEIFIPGLFLAKSNEILISRNISEVMKYVTFARCLGELAEYALQSREPNANLIPENYFHQAAVTLMAGLVAAGALDISAQDFQQSQRRGQPSQSTTLLGCQSETCLFLRLRSRS